MLAMELTSEYIECWKQANPNTTKFECPKGVTSIGDGAFSFCTGLKEIVIPEGVTSIGVLAFWKCEGLKEMVIPKGVTSIGHSAFIRCSQLSHIIVPDHLYVQLKREYSHKTIMTLQQAVKEGRMDDRPASLLPLLGIDSKSLLINGSFEELGDLIVEHLTVRDKLNLDAVAKGKRQDAISGSPKEKTGFVAVKANVLAGLFGFYARYSSVNENICRVINLGQSLEDSDGAPDLSDQGLEKQRVDQAQSSSARFLGV